MLKGTGLFAHHLIEKRFAGKLGQNINKMLSVAVTKAEHQIFTNDWHDAIKYRKNGRPLIATRQQIYAKARKIYKDYPEILKALNL